MATVTTHSQPGQAEPLHGAAALFPDFAGSQPAASATVLPGPCREARGAGRADANTLTAPLPSRSNGSNRAVAGQDVSNGAAGTARQQRRVTKAGLREVLRDCTVHAAFADRLAGKLVVTEESSTVQRMGGCGTPRSDIVSVRSKDGMAYFSEIETCKSRLCPVCGPRIAGKRARAFAQAVALWHERGPDHEVWFVRLSAQNRTDIPLAEGVVRSAKGFQRLLYRRPWRDLRERYGAHYIKVREETVGDNGWNVHLHLAIATVSDDSARVLCDLSMTLRTLWPDVMARLGYYADPMHAVHIEQVTPATADGVGSYLAKEGAWDIGSELASGVVKLGRPGHRTYEQVVADYGQGRDPADLALIHEYHAALYGRRHCSWSEGFRELLGMVPDKTDAELAGEDEEPPGQNAVAEVARIGGRALYTMLVRRQVAGLLDSAERDGLPGIRAYVVDQLGYPPGTVREPSPDLSEALFYCETCESHHLLREHHACRTGVCEHRACRERAA